MSTAQLPLSPVPIALGGKDYQDILAWPFPQSPFYEAQIKRILQSDIPQRVLFGLCELWGYRDSAGMIVGFGTLDICADYQSFVGGKYHTYVPVLAVHPNRRGKGYGRAIVQHLIQEAAKAVGQIQQGCSDLLFLDVYVANHNAQNLYAKLGFVVQNPTTPIPDPDENNEEYVIMARII